MCWKFNIWGNQCICTKCQSSIRSESCLTCYGNVHVQVHSSDHTSRHFHSDIISTKSLHLFLKFLLPRGLNLWLAAKIFMFIYTQSSVFPNSCMPYMHRKYHWLLFVTSNFYFFMPDRIKFISLKIIKTIHAFVFSAYCIRPEPPNEQKNYNSKFVEMFLFTAYNRLPIVRQFIGVESMRPWLQHSA